MEIEIYCIENVIGLFNRNRLAVLLLLLDQIDREATPYAVGEICGCFVRMRVCSACQQIFSRSQSMTIWQT